MAEVDDVSSTSAIAPLFGGIVCSTGIPAVCSGGVQGIFISMKWKDFENTASSGGGTTTVQIDSGMLLSGLMTSIYNTESGLGLTSTPFSLTFGLKTGDNAAYDVLDLYSAAGGNPSGSGADIYTTATVGKDSVEGQCGYTYDSNNNPTEPGGLSGTTYFPEQCVLQTDSGGKVQCTPEPRIWGNDTASTTNNPYYIAAYKKALQDFANEITGVSGYGNSDGHQFTGLKFAGISSHDEEISIPGKPELKMPTYVSGMETLTAWCGLTGATDGEDIWTGQASGGTLIYETSVMETTWGSLAAASASVTNSISGTPSIILDLLGDSNFPPVQPAHCSTNCSYTAEGDSQIPTLTTGEMEYIVEDVFDNAILSAANTSLQNQGLEYDKPNYREWQDSNYGTNELPCALNAVLDTGIGYQSGAVSIGSGTDKSNYLKAITNAVAYGAQYIELRPEDLANFVNDISTTDTITFNGITGYGTTTTQNVNMLSTTISAALSTMASNSANSSTGSLCPLPAILTGGGSGSGPVQESVPWTYLQTYP